MFERIVRTSLSVSLLGAATLLVAACGSSGTEPQEPLPVTADISLNPAEFTIAADTLVSGAIRFPDAGGSGASYLVVAQLTGLGADESSNFSLTGQAGLVGMPLTRLAHRTPGVAERFHGMLRARESQMAREAVLHRSLLPTAALRAVPPAQGSQRSFKVCSNIQCSGTSNVTATAQYVGAHAAIYVDNSAPTGGFSASDLQAVGDQFDQVLYPIDTDRFGAESDIDANGVVIVLLTPKINALVGKPDCNDSFIAGYFFGGDIAPGFASQYNNGEVFYGMVPDPNGQVTCSYSTDFVKRIIPVTFIHEFQHMISFNQHVLLRGGNDETLWLNEGLSHLAEELGGLHYDSLNDVTTANRFFLGNLFNAYLYLDDPAAAAVITENPPGELEQRGGAWLLVRYIVDQYGEQVTRALEQSSLTGVPVIEQATGAPFETIMGRWGLALYVSDLPSFTAPAVLKFDTWHFRTSFGVLHTSFPSDFPKVFPLVPDEGVGAHAVSTGSIGAGTGSYLLVSQAANGTGFSLGFRTGSGSAQPAADGPQLAVARIN